MQSIRTVNPCQVPPFFAFFLYFIITNIELFIFKKYTYVYIGNIKEFVQNRFYRNQAVMNNVISMGLWPKYVPETDQSSIHSIRQFRMTFPEFSTIASRSTWVICSGGTGRWQSMRLANSRPMHPAGSLQMPPKPRKPFTHRHEFLHFYQRRIQAELMVHLLLSHALQQASPHHWSAVRAIVPTRCQSRYTTSLRSFTKSLFDILIRYVNKLPDFIDVIQTAAQLFSEVCPVVTKRLMLPYLRCFSR